MLSLGETNGVWAKPTPRHANPCGGSTGAEQLRQALWIGRFALIGQFALQSCDEVGRFWMRSATRAAEYGQPGGAFDAVQAGPDQFSFDDAANVQNACCDHSI